VRIRHRVDGAPNLVDGHAGAAHLDGCAGPGSAGVEGGPARAQHSTAWRGSKAGARPSQQLARASRGRTGDPRSQGPPAFSASLVVSHSLRAAGDTSPT
jgi:hypothetical protein